MVSVMATAPATPTVPAVPAVVREKVYVRGEPWRSVAASDPALMVGELPTPNAEPL